MGRIELNWLPRLKTIYLLIILVIAIYSYSNRDPPNWFKIINGILRNLFSCMYPLYSPWLSWDVDLVPRCCRCLYHCCYLRTNLSSLCHRRTDDYNSSLYSAKLEIPIEVWLPICTYSESHGPSDRYLQNIDVYQAIYYSGAISWVCVV